jgi:hypothetical protein
MAAHSPPGHPIHADEITIRPSRDLEVPMDRAGGEDWFEILIAVFGLMTMIALVVWFRLMSYGPPVLR